MIQYRFIGRLSTDDSEYLSSWRDDISINQKLEEINFAVFSLRINGIEYNNSEVEGLKKAYEKAMSWLRISKTEKTNNTELW